MSEHDELVRRLRGQHNSLKSGYLKQLFAKAADAIEAKSREVSELKGAIYEALNNEEDRVDYHCKCNDCTTTLKGIGDTLRGAIGLRP